MEHTGYTEHTENTGYTEHIEDTGYTEHVEHTGYTEHIEHTGHTAYIEHTEDTEFCILECNLIELYMGSVVGVACVFLLRVYNHTFYKSANKHIYSFIVLHIHPVYKIRNKYTTRMSLSMHD